MSTIDNFTARIQAQLDAADGKRRQRHDRMEQRMAELGRRQERFNQLATRLTAELVLPRVERLVECIPGTIIQAESPHRCEIRFARTVRFPATVEVRLAVLHDDEIRHVAVTCDVRILPVFIKYEMHEELVVEMERISDNQVSAWVEDRLVGLTETYLKIETTDQYHQDNMVVDPVCGMKIKRSDAATIKREGKTFCFCEKLCRKGFSANPTKHVAA